MTNQENTNKYFLYARKSTEAEDRQVASIDDQIREMKKIAQERGFKIVQIFQESQSAKKVGRPIFNSMIERIEKGEAEGIICWKADRLARNMVDGGLLIDILSQGVIKHIQTYDSEYKTADNVIILAVAFGCSTQYSKDLAVNVKRGMKSRVESGWFPNNPPLGYKCYRENAKGESVIIKDDNFLLIRSLFDKILKRECTVPELVDIAYDQGIKTKRGKKIWLANMYRILKNPFYYGKFEYPKNSGEWYQGKHEPMISFAEHKAIMEMITKIPKSKEGFRRHNTTYRGVFECECCKGSITASRVFKTQKNGNKHEYTYYHCGKKKDENCNQKHLPINEPNLEKQILETIDKISMPEEIFTWAIKELDKEKAKDQENQKEIISNYKKQLEKENNRINSLIDMRADNEISKEQYTEKKKIIENNINHYQSLIEKLENGKAAQKQKTIKYFEFATNLKEKFKNGSPKTKKAITLNLGSNLSIKDRKAHFCLDFPLQPFEKYAPRVKEELALVQTCEKPLFKAQNTSLEGACSIGWRWWELNPRLINNPK